MDWRNLLPNVQLAKSAVDVIYIVAHVILQDGNMKKKKNYRVFQIKHPNTKYKKISKQNWSYQWRAWFEAVLLHCPCHHLFVVGVFAEQNHINDCDANDASCMIIWLLTMTIPCNILWENIAKHEGCQKDHLRVSLQAASQLKDVILNYFQLFNIGMVLCLGYNEDCNFARTFYIANIFFTFMYMVSLSAFRLESRSFDFSKLIFT